MIFSLKYIKILLVPLYIIVFFSSCDEYKLCGATPTIVAFAKAKSYGNITKGAIVFTQVFTLDDGKTMTESTITLSDEKDFYYPHSYYTSFDLIVDFKFQVSPDFEGKIYAFIDYLSLFKNTGGGCAGDPPEIDYSGLTVGETILKELQNTKYNNGEGYNLNEEEYNYYGPRYGPEHGRKEILFADLVKAAEVVKDSRLLIIEKEKATTLRVKTFIDGADKTLSPNTEGDYIWRLDKSIIEKLPLKYKIGG